MVRYINVVNTEPKDLKMKYLRPQKHEVGAMYAISQFTTDEHSTISPHGADTVGEVTVSKRRMFLGYFDPGISAKDVSVAIKENGLVPFVMASGYKMTHAPNVVSYPQFIEEGIIFENVEELVNYLGKGIRYEDLLEGYKMADLLEG